MIVKYFFAWFGMMFIAIFNGGFRDSVYKPYVGELAAHQISTVTFLVLVTIYIWFLTKKWMLKSSLQAWIIGILWFIMTLIFEFGMGWFIQHKSWDRLFYAYNLFEGQVWLFVPIFVLIAPILFYNNLKRKNKNV